LQFYGLCHLLMKHTSQKVQQITLLPRYYFINDIRYNFKMNDKNVSTNSSTSTEQRSFAQIVVYIASSPETNWSTMYTGFFQRFYFYVMNGPSFVLCSGYWGLLPWGVKQEGLEADHSHLSDAKGKWRSYTSTPPVSFQWAG
jgi:hypothetical protein